jgi:DNA-directed RNA polymerase subunit alpha
MIAEAGVVASKGAQKSLSLGDILELARAVRTSNAEQDELLSLERDFEKIVAPEITKDEAPFRKAVFAWLTGRAEEARTAMNRRKQNPIALFILGRICEEALELDEAVEHYGAAAAGLKAEPQAALALSRALCRKGELAKASAQLGKIEKRHAKDPSPEVAAEIAYQNGYLTELDGDSETALDLYNKALEHFPDHADTAFRMGCIFDLRGDDDLAVSYYERCARDGAGHTGAMMNLALLYEDRGDFERAIACYRDVLRVEPANRRAHLFLEGAIESTEEVYDELERKEQEKLDQVLRTPVADFELSVRSRNVLVRMNIRALGDLVQKTEAEMLAYRNFGETSLREIKQLLVQKGLRLGMRRDEVERRHKRERLALVMSDRDSRVLSTPVSELNLSVRSRRCMARLNIRTIGDLVTRTSEDLLGTKNFGHTSLAEVRAKLGEQGLSLRRPRESAEDVEQVEQAEDIEQAEQVEQAEKAEKE